MPNIARTAVVAEVDRSEAKRLCDMLGALGISVSAVVCDGMEALEAVRRHEPDIVFLHAHLPPSDGLWLAGCLLAENLTVRPQVVVSYLAGMRVSKMDKLEQNGAEMIERPILPEALIELLFKTVLANRRIPLSAARRLEDVLLRLGFSNHPGTHYLRRAVMMAYLDGRLLHDLTAGLYPAVAESFSVSPTKVEQAMRYAVELAWGTGSIEEQYRLFGLTVDPRRGKPTCGEMIARTANILKLEEVLL